MYNELALLQAIHKLYPEIASPVAADIDWEVMKEWLSVPAVECEQTYSAMIGDFGQLPISQLAVQLRDRRIKAIRKSISSISALYE
jgi:hypothetical protein